MVDQDIVRRDRQVFIREFFAPTRIIVVLILSLLFSAANHGGALFFIFLIAFSGINAVLSWFESKKQRFHDLHMRDLWLSCEERHSRFSQVYEKGKRNELSGIQEMPATIEGVKLSIYQALRKADLIKYELSLTESNLGYLPRPSNSAPHDAQSQELLQAADRNLAEYRQGLQALMSGVQRTEAQAALFMTTIDTLRMKMLGYRLTGRISQLGSHELMAAMTEAKLQLQAIDKALDELNLGMYPKVVAPGSPSVSGLRPPPPPPNSPSFGATSTPVIQEPESQEQENRG